MHSTDHIIIKALEQLDAGVPESEILHMFPEARTELEQLFSLLATIRTGAENINPDISILHTALAKLQASTNTQTRAHVSFVRRFLNMRALAQNITHISMSNKALLAFVVFIFVITGTIVLSQFGTHNPQVTQIPTAETPGPQESLPPTTPDDLGLSTDIDTIIKDSEYEESLEDQDLGESQFLASEDEIINAYDINEQEL